VISVAWTGIASILLIEGRTVHNAFQAPLTLNEQSRSSLSINSKKAEELRNADIFIWDEAAFAPLYALKAVDYLLKDIMQNNLLFGGKTFVMGGDFKQTPPVVHKGSKIKIVEASIKQFVKQYFKILKLKTNMRADPNAIEFADWLLKIGNGKEPTYKQFGDDTIKLPEKIISKTKEDLIE